MALDVRPARTEDVPRFLEIYASARRFMRESGNPDQWEEGYPSREVLEKDLGNSRLFALVEGETIHGVFVFSQDEEPTYRVIEDGAWFSDAPYGVIHRIAGDGERHGIFHTAVSFAERYTGHLRIDTHADNTVMQGMLAKLGFVHCGTIYVHEDRDPRLAFEKTERAGGR